MGEPGSGKTTQIPVYLIHETLRENHGAKLKIAIIEPRKLAASSLQEYLESYIQELRMDKFVEIKAYSEK